jgi:hypothetical protein
LDLAIIPKRKEHERTFPNDTYHIMENVNRMRSSTERPSICLYEAEKLHKTLQEFGREADIEGLVLLSIATPRAEHAPTGN